MYHTPTRPKSDGARRPRRSHIGPVPAFYHRRDYWPNPPGMVYRATPREVDPSRVVIPSQLMDCEPRGRDRRQRSRPRFGPGGRGAAGSIFELSAISYQSVQRAVFVNPSPTPPLKGVGIQDEAPHGAVAGRPQDRPYDECAIHVGAVLGPPGAVQAVSQSIPAPLSPRLSE